LGEVLKSKKSDNDKENPDADNGDNMMVMVMERFKNLHRWF